MYQVHNHFHLYRLCECHKINGLRHDKTCLCNMRTTKAQISLRIRAVISAFIIRCLDSIIPLVSISEISSLYLASVTAQAGLCLPWSQTPKTGFLMTGLNYSPVLLGSVVNPGIVISDNEYCSLPFEKKKTISSCNI